MSYSLLFEKKKKKKNELKAYREEISVSRARFETEWNTDKWNTDPQKSRIGTGYYRYVL